jgi:iron complex transport system substrate-binding protein
VIEITDVLGRKVRLNKPAERIAALSPGFVETLFAVGCGDRVVLRDPWSDYPAEARAIPTADGVKPSVRHVAGFEPNLVLLYADNATPAVPFEKVGLEVAVFDPRSFDEVVADVVKLGALCGGDRLAAELAADMRRTRDRVVAAARKAGKRPLIYVEIDGSDAMRPWTAGPGSFVHELLGLAGARNVAADVSSAYAQVSAESVIRADPEVVLLLDAGHPGAVGSAERIAARPGWSGLRAVREKRVIDFIDPDVLSRPGPRLADGLSQLFAALHPGER